MNLIEDYSNAKQGVPECSRCGHKFAPQSKIHPLYYEMVDDLIWEGYWPVLRFIVVCTPCLHKLEKQEEEPEEFDSSYQAWGVDLGPKIY